MFVSGDKFFARSVAKIRKRSDSSGFVPVKLKFLLTSVSTMDKIGIAAGAVGKNVGLDKLLANSYAD